jgi:hypothetical protein
VLLSSEVEKRVVAQLFSDADNLGWADLSVVERSLQYAIWLAHPKVGGVLTEFMSASQARVWIKDGPMKEWTRARSGVGKYAVLMPGARRTPEQLVHSALGEGWQVDDESLRIKPLRVRASHEGEVVTFSWGPQRDLKHLVWAALQAGADGDPNAWVLCVVGSFTKPIPANVRQAHLRLAERCKFRLVHLTV